MPYRLMAKAYHSAFNCDYSKSSYRMNVWHKRSGHPAKNCSKDYTSAAYWSAMNGIKRPWPVIVIASLYLLVGIVGFGFHFPELLARHPDAFAIEATELLAFVSA